MKPRVGIFGMSGCWGEQIVILNCEAELLSLASAVDIVDFLGGSSANDEDGPLAIAFVEGSVAGAAQEAALRRIRARTQLLVACGSCACFGGVSTMDAGMTRQDMADDVYGPAGQRYELSPHHALSDVVTIDLAIPGCPMEKRDFLDAVASLLNGDVPQAVTCPVCAECKMHEQDCLMLARGIPCAGPVTVGGCGARCPSYNVACIGCRGRVDEANVRSWRSILERSGFSESDLRRRLWTFAGPQPDGEPAASQHSTTSPSGDQRRVAGAHP